MEFYFQLINVCNSYYKCVFKILTVPMREYVTRKDCAFRPKGFSAMSSNNIATLCSSLTLKHPIRHES